jgi:uncharacterized protein YndB with AHSA1/START domain
MLKKIALAVAVVVAALLAFAATRPDSFRVQRSISIKASPAKVFALLNDFNSWQSWSPWEKLDPAMKRTISEPAKGKGAVYGWEGNKDVGRGRMEIMESDAPNRLVIKLDFFEPMESSSVTEFLLENQDGTTFVTWSMSGPMNYLSKVIGVFCNMDKMIGKDFEAGLNNLKTLGEKK